MTASNIHIQQVNFVPTGHGRGIGRDEPRNNTVCFTVTKTEQDVIDALSICANLRRSAILTEIATRFMEAAVESSRAHAKKDALLEFLAECQEHIRSRRGLFDGLTEKG
jgi:hypothetical protein